MSTIHGPIIASIRGFKDLDAALKTDIQTLFLLAGELVSLRDIVQAAKQGGKNIFLHTDLIKGLAKDEAAMHFLARDVKPTGIISTHARVIQAAKKYKLQTVQRFFLIDSASLQSICEAAETTRPHYLEVMPGILPKQLLHLTTSVDIPVITGGFLEEQKDVADALQAGCVAVSTSRRELWKAPFLHNPSNES